MSAQADNDNATRVSTDTSVPFRLVAEAFVGRLHVFHREQQVVKRARRHDRQ